MKTPAWPLIIALIVLFNFSSAQTSGKSITSVKNKLLGYGMAKLICVIITQNNLEVPKMRYKFAYK
jgi:hypothetical protein